MYMTTLPVQQEFRPEVVRVVSGDLTGSGFMIDPAEVGGLKGIGVSNAHVMGNGSTPHIFPIYSDNERVPVKLLALCHEYDVAFFQIPEQTQAILQQHLHDNYELDEIPYLKFADVSALKIGDKLTAIGHPLGFQHQEFSFGRFKGAQDFGSHPILFTDTELNGGNSGGCAINNAGEVVGIASLKMTGNNIDNLNGIRPIDEVRYIIPQLLEVLNSEEQQAKQISQQLAAQLGAQKEAVAKALKMHLPDTFEASFQEQCAGGKVRGEGRPFHVWCRRHVLSDDGLHEGGAQLLNYVVAHVQNGTVEDLTRQRIEAGGWVELREQLCAEGEQKEAPAMHVDFPPVELHLPRFGLMTHPLRTPGEIEHYGHDVSSAHGGVLVSTVLPKSLYANAGGQVGDIITALTVDGTTHALNWQGRAEPVRFGMTLSVDNLLRGATYGSTITAHVLRKGGENSVDVAFEVKRPDVGELPAVRQTYPNTATGMMDAKQMIPIAGITMGALRSQHVAAYQMASFMRPENQHRFQAVIHDVATTSPAYGLLTKGMRVTHVGDAEVAASLEAFVQQLQTAAKGPIFRMKASAEFGTPIQFSIRVV